MAAAGCHILCWDGSTQIWSATCRDLATPYLGCCSLEEPICRACGFRWLLLEEPVTFVGVKDEQTRDRALLGSKLAHISGFTKK